MSKSKQFHHYLDEARKMLDGGNLSESVATVRSEARYIIARLLRQLDDEADVKESTADAQLTNLEGTVTAQSNRIEILERAVSRFRSQTENRVASLDSFANNRLTDLENRLTAEVRKFEGQDDRRGRASITLANSVALLEKRVSSLESEPQAKEEKQGTWVPEEGERVRERGSGIRGTADYRAGDAACVGVSWDAGYRSLVHASSLESLATVPEEGDKVRLTRDGSSWEGTVTQVTGDRVTIGNPQNKFRITGDLKEITVLYKAAQNVDVGDIVYVGAGTVVDADWALDQYTVEWPGGKGGVYKREEIRLTRRANENEGESTGDLTFNG